KSLSAKGNFADVSTYQISFDAESNDLTIDGRAAGSLKLIGETSGKKLNISFTTMGFLGEQAQLVTAHVDLSNEKLPAEIVSTITDADLTRLLKILLPQAEATGRASATLKLSGNLMSENNQGEEALS